MDNLVKASLVLLLTKKTRWWLGLNDPQALAQLERAVAEKDPEYRLKLSRAEDNWKFLENESKEPIGYLKRGYFYCPACFVDDLPDKPCPVYRVNIGIYSQQCVSCKRLIVDGAKKADGSGPLNLFEGK